MVPGRRIGVIGVGFGAQVHVPAFRSEGWEVAAICSRSRDKASKAAQDAGIEGIHTDPLELIARDDLDAVAITTPPRSHHDLALAALAAGKHVLCEKPFALDAREAMALYEAAARSKCTAMVAHEFRYTPQRAFMRDLLAQGYVGKFRLCTIELALDRYVSLAPRPLTWQARKSEGGGMLGAIGSHYIDALRHWFGEVAQVSGWLATQRPQLIDTATGRPALAETDDAFSFTLGFRDGGTATMSATMAATPARGAKIVVMGDEGTLIAEQPGAVPSDDGSVLGSRHGAPFATLETPPRHRPITDARDYRLTSFRALVRAFTHGVDEGRSPSPNFADGLACQRMLDAVHASSNSGRVVHLS